MFNQCMCVILTKRARACLGDSSFLQCAFFLAQAPPSSTPPPPSLIDPRTFVLLLKLARQVALDKGRLACEYGARGRGEGCRHEARLGCARGQHHARHAPVPPSPTSTSLKAGTPSGVVWPGRACAGGGARAPQLSDRGGASAARGHRPRCQGPESRKCMPCASPPAPKRPHAPQKLKHWPQAPYHHCGLADRSQRQGQPTS